MKTIKKLVAFYEENKDKGKNAVPIGPFKEKTIENHKVEIFASGKATFIYHWTPICIVDENGSVTITNGGWKTVSTTQACNAYKAEFTSHGYNVTDRR